MAQRTKKAHQLLKDINRCRGANGVWLPAYNDKLVREVLDEINDTTQEMVKLIESETDDTEAMSHSLAAGLCLRNDIVDRNRRCLLVYLGFRLDRIEELRWEIGRQVPAAKMARMHEQEKVYLQGFNECLDRYMKDYVPDAKETLDLTADAMPPEALELKIRALGDETREVQTVNSGALRLDKGVVHLVDRSDVERLIRAGLVEHVCDLAVDTRGQF